MVKSPKLTTHWENALTLVAKGEYSMQEFMSGIEDMVKGKFGTYCKNKCGMNVSQAMGDSAYRQSDKKYAGGEKDFCKRFEREKGSYDEYLIPEGIEDYSYIKDGKEIKGSQYKVKLEFPKKKK